MADKKKAAAPDEKAVVKFTAKDANQLNSLAAMLDQVYDSTSSQHEALVINHPERGQMRLNQALDHVTKELRSMANRLLASASESESEDDTSASGQPGGETPAA
jgi:hypothetical protein